MNERIDITSLGWNDRFETAFDPLRRPGVEPGRVATQHRGGYTVLTEQGAIAAHVAGRLRHAAPDAAAMPVVGDWVALEARHEEGSGTILEVLPRVSSFSRKVAGNETTEQILAANVDFVFIVSSLNADLNLRRIERYLTLAYESGSTPVVVLTKADLCDDIAAALNEIAPGTAGTDVHVVSAPAGLGVERLRSYLEGHRTAALLGSSGVGKSTLINALAGEEIQTVREIREDDDRGRHTTTAREMVLLPGGGIVIDTPGMRELQLWHAGEGLTASFADIEELARRCRFGDCRHASEPGCAVTAAVESGALDPARLGNFRKLQRELLHLEMKTDRRLAREESRRWKVQTKAMRRRPNQKI